MPTYNLHGWVWKGLGSATKLVPLTLTDDDPKLSLYYTNDFSETLTIGGTTYKNPRADPYEVTFTDTGGTRHTEDLLLWDTGCNFIFATLPGSNFDSGSTVNRLGGWQNRTTAFNYKDVTCFVKGTSIQTRNGLQNIEDIELYNVIETSLGHSPVLWIGRRKISAQALDHNPKLRPIRILAGALGNGLPKRDLLVSRQHRMLVQSKISERMFGESEVLVSAIRLIALPGVFIDESVTEVEYFHLLFDQHRIIFAEGSPTESMYTGPEALKILSKESRREILKIFPESADLDYVPTPVRFIPNGKQQKKLVARHLKNNKPCQISNQISIRHGPAMEDSL